MRYIRVDGKLDTIGNTAKRYGVSRSTFYVVQDDHPEMTAEEVFHYIRECQRLGRPYRGNRRLLFTYKGETSTLRYFANKYAPEIPYRTLYVRVAERGWDIEKALTTPRQHDHYHPTLYTYQGETTTLSKLCRKFHKDPRVVRSRLHGGWDLETALTKPVHSYHKEMDYD